VFRLVVEIETFPDVLAAMLLLPQHEERGPLAMMGLQLQMRIGDPEGDMRKSVRPLPHDREIGRGPPPAPVRREVARVRSHALAQGNCALVRVLDLGRSWPSGGDEQRPQGEANV
jgi:hypothetical protein